MPEFQLCHHQAMLSINSKLIRRIYVKHFLF